MRHAVANTLASWNILAGQAINLALVSVSAVCVGAGEYKQARYYTRKLMAITIGVTAVISVIMYVSMPVLVKMYSLGPEAAKMATDVMRFHNIMVVLFWVPSFTLPNTLRSAGDVIWTMVIAILSMWIFRVGLAYCFVMAMNMGIMGVWYGMFVDWIFRAILFGFRFKGYGKRKMRQLA